MSGIFVIADFLSGALSDTTRELVTGASKIKPAADGPLSLLVITDGDTALVDQANLEGVDRIIHCDVGTSHFDASTYESVICQLGAELRPRAIMFPHSSNGLSCAPAVAARLGSGFASDVFGLVADGDQIVVTRGAYGSKLNVELGFPNKGIVVLTVRGATFPTAALGGTAEREIRRIAVDDVRGRSQHIGYVQPQISDLDVSSADFILSIGRGVGEEKNIDRFRALAQKLGATFACSRPIVDAGWLPKQHQIGQSGKTATSCKLYLALGISGAVQHLYGMKHVETIVAINTDANAPIYGVATYGAQMDIFEFADALQAQFN